MKGNTQCLRNVRIAAMLTLALLTAFASPAFSSPFTAFAAGEAAYAQGDFETALKFFESATLQWERAPAELFFDLAVVHYKLDNPYAARAWLRRYVKAKVSRPEAQAHLWAFPEVAKLSKKILEKLDEGEIGCPTDGWCAYDGFYPAVPRR